MRGCALVLPQSGVPLVGGGCVVALGFANGCYVVQGIRHLDWIVLSRAFLDCMDLGYGVFDGRRHQTVHIFRLFTLDEKGIPAAPAEEVFE
jgi:hypothetical protein